MVRQQLVTQLKSFLTKGHIFSINLFSSQCLHDLSAKLQTVAFGLGNLSHYLITGNLEGPPLKMAFGIVLVCLATQNQVRFLQNVLCVRAIWQKCQYVGVQGALQCSELARKVEWHQIVRHSS